MARLTQQEIIAEMAKNTGLKKTQVKHIFENLSALAASEVKKNGEFTLPGFGKLLKADRRARAGRNPATGQAISVPAKATVKFRLGKSMRNSVTAGLSGKSPTQPQR